MLGFRRMGRFFTREAIDRNEVSEEPEAPEDADGCMQHIQRCYLVRSVIDDLARADGRIREMVQEGRIGFVGPGCNAPVGHVIVHADDFSADMTELGPLEVLVAIAQLIGQAQQRPEELFELGNELRSAREASSLTSSKAGRADSRE